MPWQLAAVATFSLVALASATWAQGATAVVLFSAFGTAGMLMGAVAVMKLANRAAQRRIAAGDYPGLPGVLSSAEGPPELVEETEGEGESPGNASWIPTSTWPSPPACASAGS